MKKVLLPLLLTLALPLSDLAQAAPHSHDHAAPDSTTATTATGLHLNAGKKWPTDAPLRQAMQGLADAYLAVLHDIHMNRLPAAGYADLAKRTESAVADMVAQCKLDAQTDAQLHLIVAQLLDGSGKMNSTKTQRGGALQAIEALNRYGEFFDDPGFHPVEH